MPPSAIYVCGTAPRGSSPLLPLLSLALALAFAGCASMPTIEYPPPPKLAPMPTPSQFDLHEALATLEFCIDLNNEDDRQLTPLRPINLMRADRSLEWWDCINFNPAINGFPPFDSAWTLWKKKSDANVYALVFRGTVFANHLSDLEDALVATVAARYGLEFPKRNYLPLTFAVEPPTERHASNDKANRCHADDFHLCRRMG